MKKFSSYWLFALLLLLAAGPRAMAQATLVPPFGYPTSSSDYYTAGTGSAQGRVPMRVPVTAGPDSWHLTVYKPDYDTQTYGYVQIFPGDNNGNLSATALSAPVNVSWGTWSTAGYLRADVYGTCDVSTSTVAGYTKLYAVFTPLSGPDRTPLRSAGINLLFPPYAQDLSAWIPCGQDVPICGNQCVPYGSLPALLTGRVLADANSQDFKDYQAATTPFASGDNYEWVQWQYSYDNVNFYNINGNATSASFQPWACYGTTYYRRVSTHRTYSFFSSSRNPWYTSSTVTITPSSPPAAPTQQAYYACANTPTTFTISFTPGAAATSSNWTLPASNWLINGVGQVPNGGTPYNAGSATSVTITVPAGVAAGNYEIYTSSVGPCGTAGYRSITVVVGQAAPSTVSGNQTVYFGTSQRYTLSGSNSNLNWTVPYGWRITSGQGTSSITAVSPGYETYDPFQVTFTDACGSAASAELYVDNQPRPQCRFCESVQATAIGEEQGIFPNPAVGEVTISSEGQEAEATFYDARGKARKVVRLLTDASLNKVSVRDLPNGLYHVRIVGADRKTVERQLLIQH